MIDELAFTYDKANGVIYCYIPNCSYELKGICGMGTTKVEAIKDFKTNLRYNKYRKMQ